MPSSTITLPDHDELLRRLKSVDDSPEKIAKFYPAITDRAGSTLNGTGIAVTLALGAKKYLDGQPQIVSAVVMRELPEYVCAIVDDPRVRQEALEVLAASAAGS
ncbi:hypothetical protein [Streptomyces sp. NPDC024089]|uniref:hypothetical protein n=1 Tax=Streptomyces sp. NPDC024089 TaxID=3154328 RepID=UPI0033FCAC01